MMNDDYNTVVSWIAERAPTEVYSALVRLRLGGRCQGCEDTPLGQHTGPHDWEVAPPVQRRMGEVIREDSKLIADLRAELAECKEARDHFESVGAHQRAEVERLNAELDGFRTKEVRPLP